MTVIWTYSFNGEEIFFLTILTSYSPINPLIISKELEAYGIVSSMSISSREGPLDQQIRMYGEGEREMLVLI